MKLSSHSSERRSSLITGILSLAVFITLHPLIIDHLSSHLLGGGVGDGGLYVWLVQSFINDPLAALSFKSETLYPYPLTRAWSDPFFIPAFFTFLFTKVGLSFAAAYNSVILLTFASNAVSCALLARRLGLLPALSTAVGVIFANSSYLVGNLGHPQLMFFFWIPLAWWSVLTSHPRDRAPARNWGIAGLCVTGAFFCAVYYAIFASIGLAIIWFRELLYGSFSLRRALRTVLFLTLGVTPLIYALPSFLSIQRYFGPRGLHEAAHFAATGLSYISLPPEHGVFGASSRLSHSEAHLSPGYITSLIALASLVNICWKQSRMLALALISAVVTALIASSVVDSGNDSERLLCISAWVMLIGALAFTMRSRSALATFALIGVIFFIFSLGPGGNLRKNEPIFSPLGLLFTKVPGLAAIRAVGRYGSVVVLAAIISAAFGVQSFISSGQRKLVRIPQLGVAAIFLIFGLIDNLLITIPFDTPRPPAQAFKALTEIPNHSGAALILPFADYNRNKGGDGWSRIALLNSSYALWSSELNAKGLPLVNGYSGQRSKIQMQLPKITRAFPDSASLDYLSRICGLRYVVVVPTLYDVWDSAEFAARLNEHSNSFSAIQSFDDGSVLITLNKRLVTLGQENPSNFFAPRETPVRFSFSVDSASPCVVKATSIGKAKDGTRIALQSEERSITGTGTLTLSAPSSLLAASPHIIELTGQGCVIQGGCEVALDGEKR